MATPATPGTVTLKQADIDLLVAVCEQFNEVDNKQLGAKLGCSTTAAYKRWTRFKERTFGDKKEGEQSQNGEDVEGEVKMPKTPKSGKKGATGGSGKKRGRAADGDDEGTPTKKKAASKKGAKGKRGAQVVAEEKGDSEQIVNGEEEGNGFENGLEEGINGEMREFHEAEQQIED
jgi:hypothetical protein